MWINYNLALFAEERSIARKTRFGHDRQKMWTADVQKEWKSNLRVQWVSTFHKEKVKGLSRRRLLTSGAVTMNTKRHRVALSNHSNCVERRHLSELLDCFRPWCAAHPRNASKTTKKTVEGLGKVLKPASLPPPPTPPQQQMYCLNRTERKKRGTDFKSNGKASSWFIFGIFSSLEAKINRLWHVSCNSNVDYTAILFMQLNLLSNKMAHYNNIASGCTRTEVLSPWKTS